MDSILAVLTEVFNELRDDVELNDIMGDVRITNVWASPDAEFPYLVYRLNTMPQDPPIVTQGTLTLDIWDYQQTATRLYEMRRRIIELLDQQRFENDDCGVIRLFKGMDMDIPEDTQYVWHRTIDFRVRYTRNTEFEPVLAR